MFTELTEQGLAGQVMQGRKAHCFSGWMEKDGPEPLGQGLPHEALNTWLCVPLVPGPYWEEGRNSDVLTSPGGWCPQDPGNLEHR